MKKRLDLENRLRFLFVPREKFPSYRPDISVLFGQEIAERGHWIDWIIQSEGPCDASFQSTWYGCNVWVGATDVGTSPYSRLRNRGPAP